MQEVRQRYKATSLEALFNLEEEIIIKIMDYCLKTNKDIEVQYSLEGEVAIVFVLEIKIIQV